MFFLNVSQGCSDKVKKKTWNIKKKALYRFALLIDDYEVVVFFFFEFFCLKLQWLSHEV